MKPAWFPDWSGQTCVIVASGPSAATAEIEQARGRARVIAVNQSWRLAPWADALYGCDFNWWHLNKGVPEFDGLKISQDAKCTKHFRDVRIIECDRAYDRKEELLPRGLTGWGGNSGFQAVSIAAQFGPPKKIILVGFDMTLDGGIHWHGKHPKGLNNPQPQHVHRWREVLDAAAPTLSSIGVTVVNASMISALKAYPKMPLEEALA